MDSSGWEELSLAAAINVPDARTRSSFATNPFWPSANWTLKSDKADFWFIMDAFSGYQTVTRGQSVTFTPMIVPLKFTGTVTLASDGVQNIPGATASFNPGTIVTSGSSTFTVNTSATTPKGSYNITLLATNASVTKTMTVNVTVQ